METEREREREVRERWIERVRERERWRERGKRDAPRGSYSDIVIISIRLAITIT